MTPFKPSRSATYARHLTCRRVADLFQSVQLNVNNPHFLIMQGRVTKVSAEQSACARAPAAPPKRP
jgi:hypothetical protein